MSGKRYMYVRIVTKVVILALFVAVACKWYLDRTNKAAIRARHETRYRVERLSLWCLEYKKEHGTFPTQRLWSRELVPLVVLGDGDFLDRDNRDFLAKYFYDVWGNALQYRCPARSNEAPFELYSVGPNGIDEEGIGDDVVARLDLGPW